MRARWGRWGTVALGLLLGTRGAVAAPAARPAPAAPGPFQLGVEGKPRALTYQRAVITTEGVLPTVCQRRPDPTFPTP